MAVKAQLITDRYAAYNGDSAEVLQKAPSASVHFSIYSPPFGGLYHYSSDQRDLSNSYKYEDFLDHYRFFIEQIAHVTMPGRCSAVHCTDVPINNVGKDELIDFPGDVIRLHKEFGMVYTGRHTIWKEPLWVRNRTMTHSLTHATIVEDSIYGGVASADYLLMFRNKGDNKIPVVHPAGLEYYAGECPIPSELLKYKGWTGKQTENRYSHQIWRRYASSVWDDIRMNRVLPFEDCKDPDDEKHVHPLQRDIIHRAICLRTNPGETVLTPFMGVGSEVFEAVKMGRKGLGIELKESYYRQAIANLAKVDEPDEDDVVELDFGDDGEEVA